MKMLCIKEIEEHLKEILSKERYAHTLGVKEMAAELAKRYGLDVQKAELAGLLHDNAKCMSNDELRKYIFDNFEVKNSECEGCGDIFVINKNEMKNYKTLHAPVGAHLAKEKFHISDEEIISAIRWHTLGKVNMTIFEKIIFLADKIERRTREIEYSNLIMKILDEFEGETGLNKALFVCFKETVKSLAKRELYICKTTIDVYNSLLLKIKE